jgi:hypothetical protein
MAPLHETVRGMSLKARWNDEWDFVVMEEDWEYAEHPEGLGDFSTMHQLLATTNEQSAELLRPLVGGATEVLPGRFDGHSIWFFNVIRFENRADIGKLEDDAVFRINPTRLDVLCGPAFKDAVEGSGLKGLHFRKVDPDDEFGMV